MSDDEFYLSHGSPTHFKMDEAFCARMRAAIVAGLECAPIGFVTAPGTKNPKYVPADHLGASLLARRCEPLVQFIRATARFAAQGLMQRSGSNLSFIPWRYAQSLADFITFAMLL